MKVRLIKVFDDYSFDSLAGRLDDSIELMPHDTEPVDYSYDVLVAGRPSREDLELSDTVHSLVIPWAGLPKVTAELLVDFPDLNVYNLHHNAAATAEHAITLMLAAARDLVAVDRKFRNHDWRPLWEIERSLLLNGKTALILGYGAIGSRIGKVCEALGMKVNAVVRTARETTDAVATLHETSELSQLLPRADVLIVTVPWTPETEGMIGAEQLKLLPDRAIVVNVARGRVIDEAALYHELKSGRIRAGLDVWYTYPQDEQSRVGQAPSEFPFHELSNVFMTPTWPGMRRISSSCGPSLWPTCLTAWHGANTPVRSIPSGGTDYNRE